MCRLYRFVERERMGMDTNVLHQIVLDCSTIKIWDTAFRYQFKTYEFIVGCYLLAITTTMLLTLI